MTRTLNIGILAHVDAGKTTLTERLLYAAGAIPRLGSVDEGTTQTDSLELEQQRGITIKTAVASFTIDDVAINLIDTPGHPDFIAEVERALRVLDGAILVVSAVEGVQPQTRVLMRVLQRLRIPTLLFVNKIDRVGADPERVLERIASTLTPAVVAMTDAAALGTRAARVTARRVDDALVAPARNARVRPAYFGSAITGAGVDLLMTGVSRFFPSATGAADAAVRAEVFKIDRGRAGEKIAYVRMFAGTIRVRALVDIGHAKPQRVTAIDVFESGGARRQPSVEAGQIAKLRGLRDARVGDTIGAPDPDALDGRGHQFALPAMESVITAVDTDQGRDLRAALLQLAEQDPLINVRQDESAAELSVSLYGEVQKEVIASTLATDYGIAVEFHETTTVYVERPAGRGEAEELLQDDANPTSATLGLRIEPAPAGTGIDVRIAIDPPSVPLYIFKTAHAFLDAMTAHIDATLRTGLCGWQVTDCTVSIVSCDYYIGDGPKKPTRSTPRTTAADFRKLTPIVLGRALVAAGTVVCEPMLDARIETPDDTIGVVLAAVAKLGGTVGAQAARGNFVTIDTVLPAARAHELQRRLPGLTGGQATIETAVGGFKPVAGPSPIRRPRPNAAP